MVSELLIFLCDNFIVALLLNQCSWILILYHLCVVFMGLGRQKLVFWIAMLCFWVLAVPIGVILAFVVELGVFGLWWGFLIGMYLASVIGSWCLCRSVDWAHEAKRSVKRLSSSLTGEESEPSVVTY